MLKKCFLLLFILPGWPAWISTFLDLGVYGAVFAALVDLQLLQPCQHPHYLRYIGGLVSIECLQSILFFEGSEALQYTASCLVELVRTTLEGSDRRLGSEADGIPYL